MFDASSRGMGFRAMVSGSGGAVPNLISLNIALFKNVQVACGQLPAELPDEFRGLKNSAITRGGIYDASERPNSL